jgi:hypothetical protein
MAGLPSCSRYRNRAFSFCKRLRVAATKLLAVADQRAAIAAALEETVSRESAAHGAGNATAIKAQDANPTTLMAEQAAARATERRAGAAVAKILQGARIGFRINEKQSAKAIAELERGAKRLSSQHRRVPKLANLTHVPLGGFIRAMGRSAVGRYHSVEGCLGADGTGSVRLLAVALTRFGA